MEVISIPNLDKVLYPDGRIPAHVKLERRIFKGLVEHLKKCGFNLVGANDGEDKIATLDMMGAMEHCFGVDESHIFFKNETNSGSIWVFLVHGNGVDLISDYGGPKNLYEDFDRAMKGFDPEQFE